MHAEWTSTSSNQTSNSAFFCFVAGCRYWLLACVLVNLAASLYLVSQKDEITSWLLQEPLYMWGAVIATIMLLMWWLCRSLLITLITMLVCAVGMFSTLIVFSQLGMPLFSALQIVLLAIAVSVTSAVHFSVSQTSLLIVSPSANILRSNLGSIVLVTIWTAALILLIGQFIGSSFAIASVAVIFFTQGLLLLLLLAFAPSFTPKEAGRDWLDKGLSKTIQRILARPKLYSIGFIVVTLLMVGGLIMLTFTHDAMNSAPVSWPSLLFAGVLLCGLIKGQGKGFISSLMWILLVLTMTLGATLGSLAMAMMPFTAGLIGFAPVLIYLIVDAVIQILHPIKLSHQFSSSNTNKDRITEISKKFVSTSRSLVISNTIVASAFSLLVMANHGDLLTFGLLIGTAISWSIMSVLILLPAIYLPVE
ncbi:hypothetical protein [Vibrio sonorensis]|uniref:hypothetical protein n=1 Tax=Vibrio sonorensis TaxID=1004316 RepID=UPI0008DADEFB|nr:hypothetical protein [Vibrio sonorensis]